ncbi:MAG: glycoside hydrolase family 2 TIM barrel-domain containing protein [Rikenellaceae bacterium]
MNKLKLLVITSIATINLAAAQPALQGFTYGKAEAPTGKEWESPEDLAHNKELPRAWFFSFQDVDSARGVLPEGSEYWQSLDGEWSFNWAADPASRPADFYKTDYEVSGWDTIKVPSNWNIYGIQKDGELKYGVPIYCNQPVIFQHTVAVDDWRGGVMRTPPSDWVTYKHRNEVGSHRRTFTIPTQWDGREIFVNFDGVDSFFYLWINGQYIGFSKNSRNAACFNITDYVKEGENIIAVEVYRSSDGSYLEAQDMFRLPGIFRSVAIYSTPKLHTSDINVTPHLDPTYTEGSLAIQAKVRNHSAKDARDYTIEYSLYQNELYSDNSQRVESVTVTGSVFSVKSGEIIHTSATLQLKNPNLWSAEEPYRYTLVAELKDKKGRTIETISTYTGFREVEIKDTPAHQDEFGLAGRYFYVSGKPVKLKGVNRHESNPATGHVLTRAEMEEEVMLLKRANINHVRNSHYPPDPYWFYLADKYGLYLENEANIESHQYYYGEASLSHPIEWRAAHVARVMEMAHSTINAPSIVIWSLGNEAGPGDNFIAAYDALKAFDSSRPVQYERNNNIVDMGSNQYPSIAWMQGAVKGTYDIKYPFHVSEYAHSMGNACGNLVDYWDAIESTNFFCGAAIWDWIDQAMYNYEEDGTRYLAYGGDFGDKPNSGQFVMNGIIFADMEPKPQYYEVKKVYQHIAVSATDTSKGEFEIFNKYYFKDLSDYQAAWTLSADGKVVESGEVELGEVAARSKKSVVIPYLTQALDPSCDYTLKIQFALKENRPWAESGFIEAEEQFIVQKATTRPTIAEVAKGNGPKISDESTTEVTITGDSFQARFDLVEGTIDLLNYAGEQVIAPGNGPRLDALRAFTNNDNWFYSNWFTNGLHNLKHSVTSHSITQGDNTITLALTVESQAPNAAKIHGGTDSGRNTIEEFTDQPFGPDDFKFTTSQVWTIYADGSIELNASINSNRPSLILPRLGYIFKVDPKYDNFSYYGRGPIENYPDRKSGQFIEEHHTKVSEEFVPFPKPQEMSNREDLRWCALTDQRNRGFAVIGAERLSVSALPYSSTELITASHPHKLPKPTANYLRIDAAATGLGGNSCGQGGPLVHDRVFASATNLSFIIRPVADDLDKVVKVTTAVHPNLVETTASPTAKGTQVTVVEASSEEVGEGNATNLIDGDPYTYWHTMYSVTVAKHPHWVDLDAGEVKTITGFVYQPRQEGSNGDVKEYTIHLSKDGKNWGKAVAEGTFPRDKRAQKVLFDTPTAARYIRFTALSEQHGQDFAAAAELTILGGE